MTESRETNTNSQIPSGEAPQVGDAETHRNAHHRHAHHSHDLVASGREAGPLRGLLAGMATTAKTLTRKTATQHYPDVKPELPVRSRGVIALLEENCTVCMLCARECPDWCLYIDSHKETVPAATPGGRDRQRNVLDRFAIDFSLCMYCGICIEACPFDALYWTPEFEYAATDIRDLLHEKDKLGEWMRTVPAPADLDERAPEATEIASANKPARTVRRRSVGDAK